MRTVSLTFAVSVTDSLARAVPRPAELHAQLRAQLVDLRKLAPPADEKDGVSELQDAYQGLKAVQ